MDAHGLDSSTHRPRHLPSPAAKHHLLTRQLRAVSRSFYLSLRVLPAAMREPVALAYLLARAADTMADSAVLPAGQRAAALRDLRHSLTADQPAPPLRLHPAAQPTDTALLSELPTMFALLADQDAQLQPLIRDVVASLIDGMLLDMHNFPADAQPQLRALGSAAELEQYCYQVAGCVGEFWTRIARRRIPALAHWQENAMCRLGTDFGKALQLTNVLRDLPEDLRNGRCYLPLQDLQALGLTASDLLQPQSAATLRPLLHSWLRRACDWYTAAIAYFNAIPRRQLRLRLAVLWPMLIGLRTLRLLATDPHWPHAKQRVKVNRAWVYRMLLLSPLLIASNTLCNRWLRRDLHGLVDDTAGQ